VRNPPAFHDLDHVLRPQPPWNAADTTECGQLASTLTSVLTFDELLTKVRLEGLTRTQEALCMTCYFAAQRRSPEGSRG
jgi:hypothetical protein